MHAFVCAAGQRTVPLRSCNDSWRRESRPAETHVRMLSAAVSVHTTHWLHTSICSLLWLHACMHAKECSNQPNLQAAVLHVYKQIRHIYADPTASPGLRTTKRATFCFGAHIMTAHYPAVADGASERVACCCFCRSPCLGYIVGVMVVVISGQQHSRVRLSLCVTSMTLPSRLLLCTIHLWHACAGRHNSSSSSSRRCTDT